MPNVLKPLRGVRAYIHSGLTENKRSMDMGRIIAFPDMKSHLHNLPAQTGRGHNLAPHGSRDNVVLFSGVFVEYHDDSLESPRADVARNKMARPVLAPRSPASWPLGKRNKQAENFEPEHPPRLNRR